MFREITVDEVIFINFVCTCNTSITKYVPFQGKIPGNSPQF